MAVVHISFIYLQIYSIILSYWCIVAIKYFIFLVLWLHHFIQYLSNSFTQYECVCIPILCIILHFICQPKDSPQCYTIKISQLHHFPRNARSVVIFELGQHCLLQYLQIYGFVDPQCIYVKLQYTLSAQL